MSCREYHGTVESFGECDKAFSPSTSSLIETRQYRHSPPSLVSGGWTSGRVEKKGDKKKQLERVATTRKRRFC